MPTATHTPQALQGMVAVSRNNKTELLGYVCWFSVPDEDIKVGRLRRKWVQGGLPDWPLPPAQKSVNAFKRAVAAQAGISINEKNGTKTETDVREFMENSERVEYHVTRVVRDLSASRLVYEGAVRAWFTKRDSAGNPVEEPDYRPLGEVPTKEAFAIMDDIKAAYDAAQETVPGARVRTIVRKVLSDQPADKTFGFGGENLRRKAGGIYFVPIKFEHDLERLADVLWTLYPGGAGRAFMSMLPMANGDYELELVRRAHMENSVDDIDEAVFDALKVLRATDAVTGDGILPSVVAPHLEKLKAMNLDPRDRDMRSNVLAHHLSKLEQLELRAAAYADLIGDRQKEIDQRLKTLRGIVQKMHRIS